MKDYVHGGDRYGREIELDYSININPLGMPEESRQAAIKAILLSDCYPDPYCRDLIRGIRDFEGTTDQTEILTGNGAAELIYALCRAVPAGRALLMAPSFQEYENALEAADHSCEFLYLKEENDFLPVLSEIPEEIAKKAKLMIVSYPYNPVCRTAPRSFYEELVAFARKYNIFVIHDNAYSDIIYDGKVGESFLSIPGAMDIGAEFFSLSKSFNITGARVSFLLGRKDAVDALKLLRSQYDFGTFLPIQYGAIAALTGPTDFVKEQCGEYQRRRDALCGGFREIGWQVPDSEGTMFVWAPVPEGYQSSRDFCMTMVEKAGVLCTPGDAFGSRGEGYVRFALVMPPEELKKVVKAVDESGILHR